MNEFENENNGFDKSDNTVSGFKLSSDYASDMNYSASGNSNDILQESAEDFVADIPVDDVEDIPSESSENTAFSVPDSSDLDRGQIFSDQVYENNDNKHCEFYTTKTKPYKKKKYMSVKSAAVAMVFTAIVSIVGGAFLSGVFYDNNNDSSKNNGNVVSVQDNINSSKGHVGKAQQATNNTLTGDALTVPEIVDKVGPAVVGIINKTTYGDAYGYYGSLYGNLDDEIEQSSGSGVIISSDGYIVTNNHVIEKATALTVILNTGKEYEAKIIGRDASTDLAVIKIEASDLTFAQMGNSSDLRVGEMAVAIGNPLGQEFAGTTTQGIISGLNRSVTVEDKTMNLIQTDAAINPGNSGGALVNQYGYLIGINTVKISSNTLEGLGFAIPIDEAKPIIKELMTNGYVTGRPIIGIAGRAVTEDDARAYNMKVGVYVSSMTPNGPAYMAGVKIGDIVVECEGEPIETVDDINEIKNKKKPGDEISVKVYRKGSYVDLKIILGEDAPTE